MTPLLTIPEVAKLLGCSPNHIYRLIAAGAIPVVDISRPGARNTKTRITAQALDTYIEAQTRNANRLRSTSARSA